MAVAAGDERMSRASTLSSADCIHPVARNDDSTRAASRGVGAAIAPHPIMGTRSFDAVATTYVAPGAM